MSLRPALLFPVAFAAFLPNLQADLIGHWRFDEEPGATTAADELGSNHGMIVGAVATGVPGVAGNAFRFNLHAEGTGFVDMGDASFIASIVEAGGGKLNTFSFSAWLKFAASHNGQVVYIGNDASNDDYIAYGPQAARFRTWYRGGGGAQLANIGPVIGDDEWHHVALTVSPTQMKTYIDGNLINTENHNYGSINAADSLEVGRLGRASPADYLRGHIDDVQIYNRTLSEAEVLFLRDNPGMPVGIDDTVVTAPDGIVLRHGDKALLDVLANDVGLADPTTVEIVTPPAWGTAVPDSSGSILYSHLTGSPAADSFTYRVAGILGTVSDPETVTLTFSDVLRIPAATVEMPAAPPATALAVIDAFPGVTFNQPTTFESPSGDPKRLFVAEKSGAIWVIPNVTALAPVKQLYLDLRPQVESAQSENGLKGFAFHPDFASNGHLFVSYVHEVVPGGSQEDFFVRLSRFTAADSASDAPLDPAGEIPLIDQEFNPPTGNTPRIHCIDECNFGPDGYLYLGIGDGDGHPDPSRRSQKIDGDLWAGLLRIDVDKLPGSIEPNPHPGIPLDGDGKAYFSIPGDNPYVHSSLDGPWDGTFRGETVADLSKVRSEYYAVGLRNPWQFSWDAATDELWLGDVGLNTREEVNVIVPGGNYGWVHYEGDVLVPGSPLGPPPSGVAFEDPIYVYAHGSGDFQGNAVIGGLVYRGDQYPDLLGKYIFADFVSGNIWTLVRNPGAPPTVERIAGESGIVCFGIDPATDEILMVDYGDGVIRRLRVSSLDESFPQTLRDTGFFADLTDLSPQPGVVAYEPNLPFWSDHSVKRRWFALPDAPAAFGFSRDGNWTFPEGSVWAKHFDIELERGNPATAKRLETRLLVKTSGGSYGVSYRWNDEGTEAVLVPDGGASFDVQINDGGTPVTQTWQIPSRAQCMACHTPQAGHSLSFHTAQLNRPGEIGGDFANFLKLLHVGGYLDQLPESPNLLPRHVRPDETEYTLEARARSWLAVNCAYCHLDGGTGGGHFDLRPHLTLSGTGVIDGPAANDGGDPANKLIVRGQPDRSIIWNRAAAANGFTRMPPLATSMTDPVGTAVLRAWILNELPGRMTYDEWRISIFGDAVSPQGAPGEDPDGDGRTNRDEWLAGTAPLDPADFWKAEMSLTAGSVRFANLPARGVKVESSHDLGGWSLWDVSGNDGLPRAGGILDLPRSSDEQRRFFRLRIEE